MELKIKKLYFDSKLIANIKHCVISTEQGDIELYSISEHVFQINQDNNLVFVYPEDMIIKEKMLIQCSEKISFEESINECLENMENISIPEKTLNQIAQKRDEIKREAKVFLKEICEGVVMAITLVKLDTNVIEIYVPSKYKLDTCKFKDAILYYLSGYVKQEITFEDIATCYEDEFKNNVLLETTIQDLATKIYNYKAGQ